MPKRQKRSKEYQTAPSIEEENTLTEDTTTQENKKTSPTMVIKQVPGGSEIHSTWKNQDIFFTGLQWRNLNTNTLVVGVPEPPKYLQNQVQSYGTQTEFLTINNKLELCMKGNPMVKYDKLRRKWMLIQANSPNKRELGLHIMPSPSPDQVATITA